MNKTLGIVFSNMHEHAISDLTAHRCMGSIPVGGRYRLIDFTLSGYTNAGITTVGVITKTNFQSLMDHLGTGREWDLSRKNGGLVILPPFGNTETGMYHSRIEALQGIMGFIKSVNADHVLISDCDMMANIDYSDFMREHRHSGADITVMYQKMSADQISPGEACIFSIDENGDVRDMLIAPQIAGIQNVYLNVTILGKHLLEQLIAECTARNLYSFERDILQAGIGRLRIRACEFDGYISRFDSLKTYYHANLALLNPVVHKKLFPRERPVYTKIRDEAPVRYGLDARVSNSLIADGCLIEGEVEGSVLFRGVTVGKGARVKNCIIMQGSVIGEHSSLECVIADKNVSIRDRRVIAGFETYPVYISKGSAV